MEVSVEGKVTEVRDVHPEKQLSPREVTPSGISMEVREKQFSKQYPPK